MVPIFLCRRLRFSAVPLPTSSVFHTSLAEAVGFQQIMQASVFHRSLADAFGIACRRVRFSTDPLLKWLAFAQIMRKPAAKLSAETTILASTVFSRHASQIAIALRDHSVLCLRRDQDRKEAAYHRVQDVIKQQYAFAAHLIDMTSHGRLPLVGAPPSALVWMDFPRLCQDFWSERSKTNETMAKQYWQALTDCMFKGMDMFHEETQQILTIPLHTLWVCYYDYYGRNIDRFARWSVTLNAAYAENDPLRNCRRHFLLKPLVPVVEHVLETFHMALRFLPLPVMCCLVALLRLIVQTLGCSFL